MTRLAVPRSPIAPRLQAIVASVYDERSSGPPDSRRVVTFLPVPR
jgi:hypothetical protein